MFVSVLQIAAGAAVGFLCKYLCDVLIRRLLKKRDLDYTASKKEAVALCAVMALFGALIAAFVPVSPEMLFFFLLLIICEAVAVIDAHTRRIPNELVLAILLLTLLFGIPGLLGLRGFPDWKPLPALIGFAVCFLVFTLPAVMSRKVGAGDVKLAAAMGFCMGLWSSLFAIVMMGLLVLLYSLLQSGVPVLKFLFRSVPLGPFLAASMMVVLLASRLPALALIFSGLPF